MMTILRLLLECRITFCVVTTLTRKIDMIVVRIVLQNSPLHEHLRNVGFSTDDVKPEVKNSSVKSTMGVNEQTAGDTSSHDKTDPKVSVFEINGSF